MPRRRDFNNLYTQFHREKFGSENLETMFNCFEERISNFKANNPDHLMTYQRFEEKDDTPFIFCLLTPLMKRVHEQVKTSAELAFLDSSSNMEEFNLRVFLMVCHNPIGALPLGIIITSDETTDTLVRALDMFISILPKSSFFGRGNDAGPKIIMTDNCSELRDALKHAWPNAILLFCSF
uniref:MULE transposase domain-containing protein n=2 Tax=Clytia hemisphaerica TaxID=252671 RepID=A0A7M5XMD0_9CNID